MRDITFSIRKPKLSINKPNLFSVYLHFVILFIILSSGAILDQKYQFAQLTTVGLCCLSVFSFKRFKYKYIILMSAIITTYTLINYLNYSDTIMNYFLFLVKFLSIFIFVKYCIEKNVPIFEYFNKVIIAICVYSMVTYLAIDVLKFVPYNSFEVINEKPYRIFMGIHYHWQDVTWFNMKVARNNSIFWEPGVFQIFINLGLFYQFFLAKKVNKRQVSILLVSLFTTFSTTGFILAIAILVASFIKKKSKNYLMLIFKVVTLPIILFTGIYVGFLVFDQKASSTSVSYDLRSTDLQTGLELFQERPFIGWGYLNYETYEAATGTPNNSNGLVSMMFHQGILGIMFHVLPAVMLVFWFFKHKNIWTATGFGVFYFMSAATEPLMYANIFNVFICLGMVAMFEKRIFYNWGVKTNLIQKPNSQENANITVNSRPV